MDELPLKNKMKYPEALTLKIDHELKLALHKLSGAGIDTPEFCRQVIRSAADKALTQLDSQAG